jgi:hypothetical protein
MRTRRAAAVLGLALLAACAAPRAASSSPEAALDALHAAAARADGPAYFALFAPGAIFLGTDASERWDIPAFRAYAEPLFARGQGWTYVPLERHVTLDPGGRSAWFDERLSNEKYGETRGSGVLVRDGDRWLVAQYVLSFPVPNDLAPELVERIRALRR